MKRILLCALLLASTLANAQVDQETKLEAAKQQRNEQANIVIELAGRLAQMQKEIDALKAQAAECKKPAAK